jgi:hypothetical protein
MGNSLPSSQGAKFLLIWESRETRGTGPACQDPTEQGPKDSEQQKQTLGIYPKNLPSRSVRGWPGHTGAL